MHRALRMRVEHREPRAALGRDIHYPGHQPPGDASAPEGGIDGERADDELAAPMGADDAADDAPLAFRNEGGARIGRPARRNHVDRAGKAERIGELKERAEGQAKDMRRFFEIALDHRANDDVSSAHASRAFSAAPPSSS